MLLGRELRLEGRPGGRLGGVLGLLLGFGHAERGQRDSSAQAGSDPLQSLLFAAQAASLLLGKRRALQQVKGRMLA